MTAGSRHQRLLSRSLIRHDYPSCGIAEGTLGIVGRIDSALDLARKSMADYQPSHTEQITLLPRREDKDSSLGGSNGPPLSGHKINGVRYRKVRQRIWYRGI
ncbi:hypothetical protein [uncultured Porphyromonas sp.]|uniref:hypothetical protein n=1 Tax=uncultured Porphyromonas sp. TaxID=159274 RepID=UPI0025CBF6A5|nr:hypothetical protein [uncultured Porphyromonas sp.]